MRLKHLELFESFDPDMIQEKKKPSEAQLAARAALETNY